jgi:hypothetical protein
MVDQLSGGMVLKPAVKYQRVAQTSGIPRDSHWGSAMAVKNIKAANAAYEDWLRKELDGDIVDADLVEKHEKMSQSPFAFLRATYWRWAETILTICPDLGEAPPILCIGDIHLENFGTWRDVDGRLIWGVNDFDEAAKMPYVLDLVRLATSAALAQPSHGDACAAILEGYREGLVRPRPFVLDEEHPGLRELVVVSDKERAKFWNKLDKLKPSDEVAPKRYRKAVSRAMPDPNVEIDFRPRSAGAGSLGRPRWVGIATWRGGRIIREAKALVTSGWTRAMDRSSGKLRCEDVAFGDYRAPDPWFDFSGSIVVRRLSPNNRKIEVGDKPTELIDPHMLKAMGYEIANIHLGCDDRLASIKDDLDKRPADWLHQATAAATAFVKAEYEEWRLN